MNTKLLTKVIVVASVLGLISYDVWVVVEPTDGDTISEITLAWAWRSAFVPLALGVLGGHFTWPREASSAFRKWGAVGLAGIGAVVALLDVLGITPDVLPLWYFVPGVLLGHLLWPQRQMEPR